MKNVKPLPRGEKRAQILAATLILTAEKGINGTSTAEIAAKADVGMGTIYRYFESKEILLTAVFDELKDKFIHTILSNYNQEMDAYANFKHILIVLVKYYIKNVNEFRYLERYSDSSLRVGKGLDESVKLVEHVTSMVKGTKHGFKFKPLPPLVLFAMTYGPLVAIVNLVHMNKITLTDKLLDQIADACWDSILDK